MLLCGLSYTFLHFRKISISAACLLCLMFMIVCMWCASIAGACSRLSPPPCEPQESCPLQPFPLSNPQRDYNDQHLRTACTRSDRGMNGNSRSLGVCMSKSELPWLPGSACTYPQCQAILHWCRVCMRHMFPLS